MTAGFTPGPWEANGDEVFSQPAYQSICQVLLVKGEGAANARLIAAAPELYGRTERRLEQMERYLSRLSPADKMGGTGLLLEAWIKEDREILAKARGEQVSA